MDEQSKLIGPELESALTCWFNADDTDLRDMDDVMYRADIVAAAMMQSGLTKEQIVVPLQEALRRFGPEVIEEFNSPGNMAWDFNDYHEQTLQAVLKRIISVVEDGGSNLRMVGDQEHSQMNAERPLGQTEPR